MHPFHNGHAYDGGPRRIIGHAPVPSNGFSVQLQATPLVNTALSIPPPSYESRRVAFTPQLHGDYGLPEQGSGHSAYTGSALQRPVPLFNSQYLPQQATNNVYANHAAYTALRSGTSAYLPQQGLATSTTMSHAQSWIEIDNGGVDLRRRHLPPIEGDLDRNVRVKFPDGTTKIVSDHGRVVTLRMAAKAVQEWYRQTSDSSSSLLKGFRVVDGIYVAHIV